MSFAWQQAPKVVKLIKLIKTKNVNTTRSCAKWTVTYPLNNRNPDLFQKQADKTDFLAYLKIFHLFVIKNAVPSMPSDFKIFHCACCFQIKFHFSVVRTNAPLAWFTPLAWFRLSLSSTWRLFSRDAKRKQESGNMIG